MSQPPVHPRDPIGWTVLLTLLFACLSAVRLGTPQAPYFDEVHYLPAARNLLALSHPLNLEHPPLGKELIALGIALFGDRAIGWRIMPWLFGILAVFAAMRAMWFASLSRFATLSFGVLLITGFPLLVQSRIAMLDIFMIAFIMLALWMCAVAVRQNEVGRSRLAIAGAALGCAMAAKWNAVPLAMLPGLAFLGWRMRASGTAFLTAHRAPPVAGMRLPEAALWLGLLPLAVYALSYWPFLLFAEGSIEASGLVELHRRMLDLQTQKLASHTYQSQWHQWIFNLRAIWYLYEPIDGAQRGVLLVGNPLTALLSLPALAWCAWTGFAGRRPAALAVAVLYAVALGMWIVAGKNVQFFYHYLLPGTFGLAALALALDEMLQRGPRWLPLLVLGASTALLLEYYPILTAAPLDGPMDFLRWTWLESWR